VLIRAGSLSRLFEEEFSSRRIPYRLVGATKFYDRMEIRDAIAYLRLLCYPFDDISFARAISRPRRGFGDAALSKIREYARENKISLMRALRSVPLSGKQKTSADEFLAAFDFDWSAMPPADAAMQILENSGYMKSWRESKEIDAPDRIANVNDLVKNAIARYDTLTEFLEHAALMMTEDGENFTESAVSIMTIHAAKGLEFDNVFLPAWETKIFPNEKAMQDNGIEEERRLAYVAITRARKNAMISYTMARMVFGQIENNEPSQFIKEIDNKYLEFSGIRPYSGAQNSTARPQREQRNRPLQRSTMVGKLVNHSEFGNGVVIEQDSDIVIVAFRDKGIKKVRKDFLI
jgi:DNA helicase-2/ATP-dependent DNA helicase PcrA